MLLAALLDAGAELETLRRVPAALGIEGVSRSTSSESSGRHRRAAPPHRGSPTTTPTAHYRDIRELVEAAELAERARARSLDAFARLAEVEGGIHGVAARRRPLPRARLARHARRRLRRVRAARRARCRARRVVAAPVRARLRDGGARRPAASGAGDARPARRRRARRRRHGGRARHADGRRDRGDGRRRVGRAAAAHARARRLRRGDEGLPDRPNVVRVVLGAGARARRAASSCSRRTSTTSRPSSSRTRSSGASRRARSTSGRSRCR